MHSHICIHTFAHSQIGADACDFEWQPQKTCNMKPPPDPKATFPATCDISWLSCSKTASRPRLLSALRSLAIGSH